MKHFKTIDGWSKLSARAHGIGADFLCFTIHTDRIDF